MLRLLSDEDVHDDIIRGLRRREPTLDIVRAVDVGLMRTADPIILAWAADHERILITGDLNTMIGFAWDRVHAARVCPECLRYSRTSALGKSSTTFCSSRNARRRLTCRARFYSFPSDGHEERRSSTGGSPHLETATVAQEFDPALELLVA